MKQALPIEPLMADKLRWDELSAKGWTNLTDDEFRELSAIRDRLMEAEK